MGDLVLQGSQINLNSDGSVRNFQSQVSSCNIVSYTTHERASKYGDVTGNLINEQFSRNFGGGTTLIDYPSDDENGTFFRYDNEVGGYFDLEPSKRDGQDVGTFVTIKGAHLNGHSNANKKIITSDGFLVFENAIREGNIMQKYVFRPDSDYLQLCDVYSNLKNYTEPNDGLTKIRNAEADTIANYYQGYINFWPNYRQEISSDLSKKGILNAITNNWHVYETPEAIEYYSVDGKWSLDGRVNISAGGKGLIHSKNGAVTFDTYDEPGSTNSEFNNEVNHGNVYTKLSGDLNGYTDIIKRTNKLFRDREIDTIVNRFHTEKNNFDGDDLVSSYSKYGISRGRNLLTESAEKGNSGTKINGYDNPYCRVWTAHHQYSKLSRRIRPFYDGDTPQSISTTQGGYGAMRPNGSNFLEENTVLTSQGFVRVTPSRENRDVRKCMFSIENLAWRDIDRESAGLSKEQMGPNGGRIMWFPPYNLKFTENVNVDWSANKFIGRGEQIYTYTNTDRSGTLNFTLLIDHPSVLDKFVGKNDGGGQEVENQILRFFAGCNNLEGSADGGADNRSAEGEQSEDLNKQGVGRTRDIAYIAFFPSKWSGKNYVNDLSTGLNKLREYETRTAHDFTEVDLGQNAFTASTSEVNVSRYRLNDFSRNDAIKNDIKERIFRSEGEDFDVISIFDSTSGITKISELVRDGKFFNCGYSHGMEEAENLYEIESIEVNSSAASQFGYDDADGSKHDVLSSTRARFLYESILEACPTIDRGLLKQGIHSTTSVNDIGAVNINSKDAKMARYAYVVFHVKWNENNVPTDTHVETGTTSISNYGELNGSNYDDDNQDANMTEVYTEGGEEESEDYRYDNEYLYFNEVRGNEMVYKYIAQKVQYFDPAFHSITPEGFNARLTFLHQCTRQGPTSELSSGKIDSTDNAYLKYAGNLSFGRPPYCILRIGDFYYTKICITSMSIDYDTGGGIQWDLNQEGIGVQPMFANVSLNFNFLGGHSLDGPIERLQNAITHNFYANAPVYDDKADKENKIYDPAVRIRQKSGNKTQEELDAEARGIGEAYQQAISGGGGVSGRTAVNDGGILPSSFAGYGGGDFGGAGTSRSF